MWTALGDNSVNTIILSPSGGTTETAGLKCQRQLLEFLEKYRVSRKAFPSLAAPDKVCMRFKRPCDNLQSRDARACVCACVCASVCECMCARVCENVCVFVGVYV